MKEVLLSAQNADCASLMLTAFENLVLNMSDAWKTANSLSLFKQITKAICCLNIVH